MKIAYSCNDVYIEQTGISMISVMENHKDVKDIIFYLIAKDISEQNKQLLHNICEGYGRELFIIEFDSICYDLKLSDTGRHIETIYTKVFFSRIEGLDKAIYLDSDTVVVGSLKELWDDSLDGYYMGVVETLPTVFYKELDLPQNERFFNDGMAYVNVDYCRKNHLIEQVLKVVNDFNGIPPTLSEGALNKVCYGKVKYISPKYNLLAGILYLCNLDVRYVATILHYSELELRDSCKNPVVIHYLTAFYNRPWFKNCSHPYKNKYYEYKAISPWNNVPLKKGDLPARIKLIDMCYRYLGVVNVERIRFFLKQFKNKTFETK